MRLLLDTHIACWATRNPARLSRWAGLLISDPGNEVFYSHASLWEIAIKTGTGRPQVSDFPPSSRQALMDFEAAGFSPLAITPDHIEATSSLASSHPDPFDRMLVAQAMIEPMRLVTHDRKVHAFSDTIILV